MSWVQENWNDYYKDKQWIDTKGWCDLNGNPIPFEHDNIPVKKPIYCKRYTKRLYADKVSFAYSFLKYVLKILKGFLVFVIIGVTSVVAGNEHIAVFMVYVWGLSVIIETISFIRFICRCIKDNILTL